MRGSLNDILPEPISAADEKILLDHLKRKMRVAGELSVLLLHAMEERFGPEAREVARELAAQLKPAARPPCEDRGLTQGTAGPEADLRAFCAQLDRHCVGSHLWERVVDEPCRIGYHYSRCMWAEVFRELGEPELGLIMCAGDEPAVAAYNRALAFHRTKTLMAGYDHCDHVFYVAP
jgi:hypothetical protein